MECIFNKLVRDKIPEIIEKNGDKACIRVLDIDEYKIELERKLLEETNEVISSKNSKEQLEELADLLEVIKAIAEINNKSLDDVMDISKSKRLKRGGFKKRIYLEKTYNK